MYYRHKSRHRMVKVCCEMSSIMSYSADVTCCVRTVVCSTCGAGRQVDEQFAVFPVVVPSVSLQHFSMAVIKTISSLRSTNSD